NFPAQTTPFVGREAELAELHRLLADPTIRLVTILGPGGMGKSRLSLEVADAELANYKDGAYFVSLAPLSAPEGIVPAIAEAVSFSFSGPTDPKEQILNFLRGKRLLLILDNFEHLLIGAPLVTDILQA